MDTKLVLSSASAFGSFASQGAAVFIFCHSGSRLSFSMRKQLKGQSLRRFGIQKEHPHSIGKESRLNLPLVHALQSLLCNFAQQRAAQVLDVFHCPPSECLNQFQPASTLKGKGCNMFQTDSKMQNQSAVLQFPHWFSLTPLAPFTPLGQVHQLHQPSFRACFDRVK